MFNFFKKSPPPEVIREPKPLDQYPKELDDLRNSIPQYVDFSGFPGKIMSVERTGLGTSNEQTEIWYVGGKDNDCQQFHISRAQHKQLVEDFKTWLAAKESFKTPETVQQAY